MAFLRDWKSTNELQLDEILEYLGDMKAQAELESHARRDQDASVQALMRMMQGVRINLILH